MEYNPLDGSYTLPPEQTVALTDESSPAYLPGFFQIALGTVIDSPRITESARNGAGVDWHEHNHDVFDGCERFFRPGYNANLIPSWLPALDGVVEKLKTGAKVADIGCGHGSSTILMAQAYPNSRFIGSDYHAGSIETARARAAEAGVAGRVRFETAPAAAHPGRGYDLVTMFDCLHDMGDPVSAARHVREALAPDGTWMIVEPMAGDRDRGQPQSRRPRLLRIFDIPVYAGIAVAGSRTRARRASGRGEDRRCRRRGRVQSLPACDRDTVQSRVRGPTLSAPTPRRRRGAAGRRGAVAVAGPRAVGPAGAGRSRGRRAVAGPGAAGSPGGRGAGRRGVAGRSRGWAPRGRAPRGRGRWAPWGPARERWLSTSGGRRHLANVHPGAIWRPPAASPARGRSVRLY